jgi:Tol biopolymer transport system component/predicted Ser/Thr protein kinase
MPVEKFSMIGKTLGHYQITEKLGEGGMGVVYKAHDTHLDRFVAIKVLPAEKVADSDRKRRFVQEAKAASALNHPNIIHVYDIDQADDTDFIAMEYVEGRTLAQLIPRRGMQLGEALRHAVQIANALARAHGAGIVHRDLKPSNIMVDEHGLVKVLDFGLAKLVEPEDSNEADSTRTLQPQTQESTIVGTAAYMSPEQAEGKKVDARSDIFSFGSVLYEMVTGRRAFRGASVISTLSAILHLDPKPVAETVAGAPLELQRIIARCLRKGPERRFQSIADVSVVLEELRDDLQAGVLATDDVLPKAVSRPRASIGKRWLLAAALVMAGVAAGFWMTRQKPPFAAPVLTRLTFDSGLTFEPALSPDGKLVAYASDRSGDGNLDIWVQQVAGGAAIRLTHDEADDREPAFSPDGGNIAFRSERDGGGIYVVPAIGGNERLIAPNGRTPRFSPDGQLIAYWIGNAVSIDTFAPCCGKIFVVPSTGAPPRQLRPEFLDCRHPTWTPDGKHVLFVGSRYREDTDTDWWVTPIEGGEVVATGAYAAFGPLGFLRRYSPYVSPSMWLGDHVIFSVPLGDTTNLWRIPISSNNWRVTGVPEKVTFGTGLEVQPSIAAQGAGGACVAFANVTSHIHVWSLPADPSRPQTTGDLKQLTTSVDDRQPSLSADGRKLVFCSNRTGNTDVWVKDLSNDREIALTATPMNEDSPKVTLDGRKVAYNTADQQGSLVHVDVVPAGGGVPERVCDDCGILWDWSSDGRWILFAAERQVPIPFVGAIDTSAARKADFLTHPR